MTPDFQLLADGVETTAVMRDRLLSLSVSDEEGMKADVLSLELDDRDHRIDLPAHGARLALWLGYRETGMSYMGSFVTDSTGGSEPPYTVSISATAADMATPLRAPKTRPWQDVTLGSIVARIAADAGLEPLVSEAIAGTQYSFVAQSAESDLHLLTRLARVLDATAKPADGKLLVLRRGEGVTATGEPIPPRPVRRFQWSSIDWQIGERGKYASVTAQWSEISGGAVRSVTAGEGAPEQRLRHPFSSQSEAERAAAAALAKAQRGDVTVDVTLGGFDPTIFAGALVSFPDLRTEFAGNFHVKSVRHDLGAGLVTSFSVEKASPP